MVGETGSAVEKGDGLRSAVSPDPWENGLARLVFWGDAWKGETFKGLPPSSAKLAAFVKSIRLGVSGRGEGPVRSIIIFEAISRSGMAVGGDVATQFSRSVCGKRPNRRRGSFGESWKTRSRLKWGAPSRVSMCEYGVYISNFPRKTLCFCSGPSLKWSLGVCGFVSYPVRVRV